MIIAQVVPVAEVHLTTACWPGGPDWPEAVKPPEPLVSVVITVPSAGDRNGTCRQLAPPSADSSANGTAPAGVTS